MHSFIVPSFPTIKPLCQQYAAAAAAASDDSKSWHYVPHNGFDSATNKDDTLYSCDAVVSILDVQNNALNEYRWIHSIQHDESASSQDEYVANKNTSSTDHYIQPPNLPTSAMNSIKATHRWASHFVRRLQLCPWAASSLDTFGAIRYWILLVDDNTHGGHDGHDDDVWYENIVFHHMERMVHEAGVQLEQITQPNSEKIECDTKKSIDPSAAISFVICAPYNSSCRDDTDVSFESFHEFFVDLEDQLLDECDDYWDGIDATWENENDDSRANDESDIPQCCKITIAAFHPNWRFNSQGTDDMKVSAVDYEKRTPYPTISIVMSSAIDSLVPKDDHDDERKESGSSVVTNRIAASNEQTLCGLGVDKLKEIVVNDVLRFPNSNASSGM